MVMNIEAEIRDLKRGVSEIEGSFGFLAEQVKTVHRDLLAFQDNTEQRFKRVDERFDRLDKRIDSMDNKIDSLDRKIDTKIDGLTKSLPGIVSDALSDYEIKSKKR